MLTVQSKGLPTRFIPTPDEAEILGGMLLEYLAYCTDQPLTSEECWNGLTDWIEETDFAPLIRLLEEPECGGGFRPCSDGKQPKFARSATARAMRTRLEAEQRFKSEEQALWNPSSSGSSTAP